MWGFFIGLCGVGGIMEQKNIKMAIAKAQELCKEHDAELLFLSLFGSTLYGTATPGKSDMDIRGIFLPSLASLAIGSAPKSLHWSSGDDEHRNSAADVDIDLWSIQHWLLKLLPAGDTGATDLLFSPSNPSCTLYRDNRLDGVFGCPNRFLDVKHCRAYADYSLGQAKKYGIKGSRLGALRAVHHWVTGQSSLDQQARLESILEKLVADCGDGRYCSLVDSATGPALQLCGKIHVGGIRIREFVARVETDMEKYGARAIEAEKNQGLDFKALSHAFRAFDQMEQLYRERKITFPLKSAQYLMSVKRGDYTWAELEPRILERLAEIEAIRNEIATEDTFDREYAEEQIKNSYGLSDKPEAPKPPSVHDFSVDGVPPAVVKAIRERLHSMEIAHDIRILYAVETGSRGWGFASADSDYDVRFVYLHKPEWYLDKLLRDTNDTIENAVETTSVGDLDICGWDLVKTLNLFRNSNASITEWLSSPIVYHESGSLAARLREIAPDICNSYRQWHHYFGMVKSGVKKYNERHSVKAWLYILRPLLMTIWIEKYMTPPPMRLQTVLDKIIEDVELRTAIDRVIENKKLGKEKDIFEPPALLASFVRETFGKAQSREPRFSVPKKAVDYGAIFRRVLNETW